ncbi:NAD(P)/FAD-dependent oxidoreductase [Blastococcus mobilis]|uniref:Glycine/D-amino acid oxidase n=1 Tax=Blastococcus mobilis TaxID=1938746 RepID=A0A238Y4D2_9ACTN|nr:FAD-binding oxidoreductase [Blastococcus mobilis]SNR65651.1 Glycine/D-amino acid oxidase [Blastococcus mobilis]
MAEPGSDVVVVGAGIIGAACAFFGARAGLSITVLDRGSVGGGTTSRCEGNILVSDKGPGPELDLALASRSLWLDLAAEHGAERYELEEKGGLVVATSEAGLSSLRSFAAGQGTGGVIAEPVASERLRDHEPNLAAGLPGGAFYPQDMQVQPVLAAASLLAAARDLGARVVTGEEVTGALRGADGRITAVRTARTTYPTAAVVNAAGTWGAVVGERLGGTVPVLPRRGFILVTEPLPRVVRHKVYSADYVDNVASGDAGLETSAVVEGTRGGTVLIGASRERVGFDETLSVEVLRRLAAQAVRLFPFLAQVRLMRSYRGFRPYCPDHLPVIGSDRRVPGLLHACGHEGAGIGLAPATGRLVADLLTGAPPQLDPAAFDPMRFVLEDA